MRSVFDLITRLNEIHKELNDIGVDNIRKREREKQLITEYDEIVFELWGHIPELRNSADIQPKRRVRKYEGNRFVSKNK